MKRYNKPLLEELLFETSDVLLVSASDETLDYNGGVEEEWN